MPALLVEVLAVVPERLMQVAATAKPHAQLRSPRDVELDLRAQLPLHLRRWLHQVDAAYSLQRHSTVQDMQGRVAEVERLTLRTPEMRALRMDRGLKRSTVATRSALMAMRAPQVLRITLARPAMELLGPNILRSISFASQTF